MNKLKAVKIDYSNEQLRPNGQRAKTAIILIWIVLVFQLPSLVSAFSQYQILTSALENDLTLEIALSDLTPHGVLDLALGLLLIITGITFIQWFRRTYFNLHTKVNYLAHAVDWAAGSWFVPIMNLYRPYQIMKEIYNETKKLLTKNNIEFNPTFSTKLLGWWWILWLLKGSINFFEFLHLKFFGDSLETFTTVAIVSMVRSIIMIPLSIITIKIIKDYSTIEPLLNEIQEESKVQTTQ